MTARSVAVVGGGISGLAAAFRLRRLLGADVEITVIDSADRIGGKLRTVEFGGGPFDLGAEAFVGRRPEIPALLTELGLSDQLVYPSGLRPLVWAGSALHPLPAPTLMGIPLGPDSMAGLVDDDTIARIEREPETPFTWEPGSDIAVGDLVAHRFGEQVVQRSVDPLLGGVYAGLASSIGVRAAVPTLAAALDRGATSLTQAVGHATPEPKPGPVFGGLRDGYGVLLNALAAQSGADFRLSTMISGITRVSGGWAVEPVGEFDDVVLALPATALATLLTDASPAGAAAAQEIPLASSALVALDLPRGTDLPANSGILVATGESLRAKAFTLSSRKWPHLAARRSVVVRASFGRSGESLDDTSDLELIAAAEADLATVTGLEIRADNAFVQRWPGGLPQYGPGHTERVAAIEAAVAELDGIEVAGALLHGVGVPACVASGTAAAERVAGRVAR